MARRYNGAGADVTAGNTTAGNVTDEGSISSIYTMDEDGDDSERLP